MWTLVSKIVAEVHLRLPSVFFLVRPCGWVTMTEDEVYLVRAAALIWTEHDGVWGGITEPALESQSQAQMHR